jgi:hypothetical protein
MAKELYFTDDFERNAALAVLGKKRRGGQHKIDVDSAMENFFLILAFCCFMCAAFSLIFVLDSEGKTAVPHLVASLVGLAIFAFARWRTDCYYWMDTEKKILWFHQEFFGEGSDEEIADFKEISAVGIGSDYVSDERRGTTWFYFTMILLNSGRVIKIPQSREADIEGPRRLARALADVMDITYFPSQCEKTVGVKKSKAGKAQFAYDHPLVSIAKSDNIMIIAVMMVVILMIGLLIKVTS